MWQNIKKGDREQQDESNKRYTKVNRRWGCVCHHSYYLLRIKINWKFFPKSQIVMLLFHTPLQRQVPWILMRMKEDKRRCLAGGNLQRDSVAMPSLLMSHPVPPCRRESVIYKSIMVTLPKDKYFPVMYQPHNPNLLINCKYECFPPGLKRLHFVPSQSSLKT